MQTSGGIWDNPDEFQPERHLSNDEKTLKPKHEANLPFGVGKRYVKKVEFSLITNTDFGE